MKIKYIVLLALLIFPVVQNASQSTQAENKLKINQANEVINQARHAVYQDIKKEEIKSVYLKTDSATAMESVSQIEGDTQPREIKSRQTAESNISVEFSGKARQEILSYNSDKNPSENFSKVQILLNGEKFSQTVETIVDGKAFDMSAMLNAPFMPESVRKQMKEALEKAKPTKEGIQKALSEQFFPILLSPLWSEEKVFIYVGKAEAGDGMRADVLEIESHTSRQTRWFFDEKTHLLLMITDEISKNGISAKTTQYFSDYQLINGLMIAKKLNVETESINEMPEMEIMGKRVKMSGKSKSVAETTIKEFKINPTFKPETFAVKEDNK